jgi:hypothetical protein
MSIMVHIACTDIMWNDNSRADAAGFMWVRDYDTNGIVGATRNNT